ncbi:MAG: hypothetical protein JWQ95_3984 [Sphaerisporangium sp.]|jgi:hypothetical protein|nr:hypothetical protein [Sphaerisporangium sp.]
MAKWKRTLAVTAAGIMLTALVPAEAALAVPLPAMGWKAPGKAINLKLTEMIRHKLADAFWNQYYAKVNSDATRDKVDGPKDVYYGKIKGTTAAKDVYWAVGFIGIKGNPVSYQDGPHVWRKRYHGAWAYLGDTGGCLAKVPKTLLRIWHLPGCD